jgi:hypothetical protein
MGAWAGRLAAIARVAAKMGNLRCRGGSGNFIGGSQLSVRRFAVSDVAFSE